MPYSEYSLVGPLASAPEAEPKVAPCPSSPRFLLDEADAWKSLTVFWFYRLVMGGIVVNLFLNDALPSNLDQVQPEIFAPSVLAYLAAIVLAGILLVLRRPAYPAQAQLQIFADIALLPFVIHASGGFSSGAGVLLGITVAAGGILVGGRCALLFAALASLAILVEEVYTDLRGSLEAVQYTYGGLLGASFFGVAYLALELARRAERNEAIAEQRGTLLGNLQQINEYIIRNLQTGILVIEDDGAVRLINDAAGRLLPAVGAGTLMAVSPRLASLFADWQADPGNQILVLDREGDPDIHVRFARLGRTRPPLYMINLEDSALYNRRVQLSKLASLGRLTASIAHEIRNPLSAISHASQLLAESPALGGQDLRLIQIILDHAARLNTVVENVLQISRRTEAKRDVLRVESYLSQFLADFAASHAIDPAQFRLESEIGDPEVAFDLSHLQQILENLCSNALKYGHPERGSVTLRVVRRYGQSCVEFIDHAPTLDPETVRSLFEPFFTTDTRGTGLGLYISRELAELNQARLEYVETGDGSCFRLSFCDAKSLAVE